MSADSNTAHTSRPKYHALITYVPEEFIWCDWLHRQIDGTPVPADLANQRTRHGFTRPAVVNVFPDPRNPAHLARHATSPPPCRHLIVVCSPHSATSPALDAQIRNFKRTEGEDRIVVLVADGDPEHDSAPAGRDDAQWLPAWLRWRLDKHGNFRPAEASEPQIIDARADKLSPPEARAQLLAALLDIPRDNLRSHGDLVRAEATDSLVPASGVVEAAPAPEAKGGRAGVLIAAAIVVAGVGAYLWSTQQKAKPAATAAVESASLASDLKLPSATPAPVATPRPSTPQVVNAKPSPVPVVALPAKVTVPAPALPVAKKEPAPPPPVATVFMPSDGPETPVTSLSPTRGASIPLEPGSSWQRMRDLGDTLLSRENRDTGLIALAQAVDTGLRTASLPDTPVSERLDIGRLCFRVGALQKQFVSPREARRILVPARAMLERMRVTGEDAAERDSLLADIDQLLRGIPR